MSNETPAEDGCDAPEPVVVITGSGGATASDNVGEGG